MKIFLAVTFFAAFFLMSCSDKIANPRLAQLEGRKQLLAYNTEINNLNLKLEKKKVEAADLKEKITAATNKSRFAADYASNISKQLSQNAQNSSLSKKAQKASRTAADRAEEVKDLNDDLQDTQDDISDLQKDINDTNGKIIKLQSRIQFVPNTNP